MNNVEELDLLLTLIRKYNLPLSPILEYAVNEKKGAYGGDTTQQEENEEVRQGEEPEDLAPVVSADATIADGALAQIPEITAHNRYVSHFCHGMLKNFGYVLDDREKDICKMLLLSKAKKQAAQKYKITQERVRQLFYRSIRKISGAYRASMRELTTIKQENEELNRQNYLLETTLASTSSLEDVEPLRELEDALCDNARRLLACPIKSLPLSARTLNVLRVANVEKFREIPQLQYENVLMFKNCGRKTVLDLRLFLLKYNLDFGMTYDEIVSRLSKFSDKDFDQGLLPCLRDGKRSYKCDIEDEYGLIVDDLGDDPYDEQTDLEVMEERTSPEEKDDAPNSSLPVCETRRNGVPWTPEEEATITDYYKQGHSFSAIAGAIGRSEVAVLSRLGQLGLIYYTYGQEYNDNRGRT